MKPFVRASRLYNVATGDRIPHPAVETTDAEARAAIAEVDE